MTLRRGVGLLLPAEAERGRTVLGVDGGTKSKFQWQTFLKQSICISWGHSRMRL